MKYSFVSILLAVNLAACGGSGTTSPQASAPPTQNDPATVPPVQAAVPQDGDILQCQNLVRGGGNYQLRIDGDGTADQRNSYASDPTPPPWIIDTVTWWQQSTGFTVQQLNGSVHDFNEVTATGTNTNQSLTHWHTEWTQENGQQTCRTIDPAEWPLPVSQVPISYLSGSALTEYQCTRGPDTWRLTFDRASNLALVDGKPATYSLTSTNLAVTENDGGQSHGYLIYSATYFGVPGASLNFGTDCYHIDYSGQPLNIP